MVRRESRSSTIGHITLGMKQTGAPSAGNPHAGCDVAGAGNGFTVGLLRHSQRKRGETDRPDLRNTAPVLDPTPSDVGSGGGVREPETRTLADLPFLADSSLNDWAVSRQLPHTAKAHAVVLVVGANYQ
jgi:hypothetical protein